jgi:hypothetical protein
MKQPIASHTPLEPPEGAAVRRVLGVVQHVDLVGRELGVQFTSGEAVFDVPPDCPIVLHGERIKLRLVQPGDEVAIAFSRSRGLRVVRRLEVQPGSEEPEA